jgi:hypothetical protein
MKKSNFFLALSLSSLILLTSCGDEPKEVEKITTVATYSYNAEDTLVDKGTRFQGEAHGGQFVFRADSLHSYSGTTRFDLNDSLVNSNLRVVLNFWAKANTPVKGDGFAVSFQDDEKGYFWGTFEPFTYGAKPNEWVNIIDSVNIDASLYTKTKLYFKFFSYTNNKSSVLDIDDVNITVKKVEKVMEE